MCSAELINGLRKKKERYKEPVNIDDQGINMKLKHFDSVTLVHIQQQCFTLIIYF